MKRLLFYSLTLIFTNNLLCGDSGECVSPDTVTELFKPKAIKIGPINLDEAIEIYLDRLTEGKSKERIAINKFIASGKQEELIEKLPWDLMVRFRAHESIEIFNKENPTKNSNKDSSESKDNSNKLLRFLEKLVD